MDKMESKEIKQDYKKDESNVEREEKNQDYMNIEISKKNVEGVEKNKVEFDSCILLDVNKHKQDLAKVKKEAEKRNAGMEIINKVKKDLEEALKNALFKDAAAEFLKKTVPERRDIRNKVK